MIKLNIKGYEVLIDEEDYDLVSRYTWDIDERTNTNYARAYVKGSYSTGKIKKNFMHKLIMGVCDIDFKNSDIDIDHRNDNGLDNRKENLRFITRSGNNRRARRTNKTGYRGVQKHRNCERYQAVIRIEGKKKYLGSYDTPKEASIAYEIEYKKQLKKEMVKILIVTIGLPQSSKSTWSRSLEQPIINRDSIRWALGGSIRYFSEEEKVSEIEKIMVKSLFYAGHDIVIVDATHLKQKYRDAWETFANKITDFKCKVVYKRFRTSVEECIERAKINFPEDENFPSIIFNMWENAEIDFNIPRYKILKKLKEIKAEPYDGSRKEPEGL